MTHASDPDIPRRVAASEGFQWLLAGFRLYRRSPLLLSAAFGVLFGVVMAFNLIPAIGGSLSELAMPLVVAGFMAAYRALDSGRELELPHFLSGVQGPLIPLMTVGAVQLLGSLLIGQVMLAMGFDPQAVMETARSGRSTPAEMQALMNGALPAVMTGLVLFIPLMMATWFAPALILFGGARPLTALTVSLRAMLRNLPAMFVNSLTLGVMLMLANLIPMLLGLLVAMPILFGALYASYQALFAVWDDGEATADIERPVTAPDESDR